MHQHLARSLFFGLVLAVATGCSMTVNALNPRPNVVVAGDGMPMAIDVGGISDDYEIGRVHVHEFKKSLTAGFRNAVGDKATTDAGALRLVVSQVSMELANIGSIGQFVTIRYRAKWLDGQGRTVAQVAGVAQPRNPTETGPRHLEDAIEVMVENMIDGLDKATRRDRAPAPATVGFLQR
ncbi:MAG: hypothetical protein U0235_04785 [Polyangiaceae bacterium]